MTGPGGENEVRTPVVRLLGSAVPALLVGQMSAVLETWTRGRVDVEPGEGWLTLVTVEVAPVGAAPALPSALALVPDVTDVPSYRACRACGCTDERACDGGCWWVEIDLCSACAPLLIDDDSERHEPVETDARADPGGLAASGARGRRAEARQLLLVTLHREGGAIRDTRGQATAALSRAAGWTLSSGYLLGVLADMVSDGLVSREKNGKLTLAIELLPAGLALIDDAVDAPEPDPGPDVVDVASASAPLPDGDETGSGTGLADDELAEVAELYASGRVRGVSGLTAIAQGLGVELGEARRLLRAAREAGWVEREEAQRRREAVS